MRDQLARLLEVRGRREDLGELAGSPSLGHSRWAVSRASSSSAKQTFVPACTGPLPPSERYSSIAPRRARCQKPSPISAASSVAFGPNPETSTGGGSSGSV